MEALNEVRIVSIGRTMWGGQKKGRQKFEARMQTEMLKVGKTMLSEIVKGSDGGSCISALGPNVSIPREGVKISWEAAHAWLKGGDKQIMDIRAKVTEEMAIADQDARAVYEKKRNNRGRTTGRENHLRGAVSVDADGNATLRFYFAAHISPWNKSQPRIDLDVGKVQNM